ncbi:hypothetical protein ACJQWK_02863 [Exserohilum turcicum]|uniref:C2H2-type domain-containing protein n=1 Tax=Exserohilum turcicum (strain 28A) TaxID=671987 RepID=R0JYI2_EXST2|nr:uncharacterized protein SETTUDRAFT_169522 [Exserohilum turcica Et28A]EOA85963.1 hypothetical protein SETTUDRAFT_169522 [Exserohilum turcica Et28A]
MYYDDRCEKHDLKLGSQQATSQHMDALGHWALRFECKTCGKRFRTQDSADQHMRDTGHPKLQFKCETCNRRFGSQSSVNQHMSALDHYKRYYCYDCAKAYQDDNSLKMHWNSSIHRGKNVTCLFCKAAFTSASGLSHHLETSSCLQARSLSHRIIFNTISLRDCNGLLTNKLLTDPDDDTQNGASNAAWNGSDYECYLCHREYNTLQALNQHLNSPAHSEKLYHCPNRSCNRQFGRLASLFNHLESESCNFVRFEKVQKHVHNFITGQQKLVGFV